MAEERYEVRLVKIDGDGETVVETKKLPLDKIREYQVARLPDREAMSLVNASRCRPRL